MKRLIFIGTMAMSILAAGCSSESKQKKMWDSSVAADTHIIDTTGSISDTARTDSVNRDQSVKSDSVRQ